MVPRNAMPRISTNRPSCGPDHPRTGNTRPPERTTRTKRRFSRWREESIRLAAFMAVTSTLAPKLAPECKAQPAGEPVTKIRPGTVIKDSEPPLEWTDCLLIAEPRVTDGDIDAVSRAVKRYAELWKFVIVARTQPVQEASSDPENDPPRYQLDDVGVGLAMARSGDLIVASGKTGAGGNGTDPNVVERSGAETKPPRLGLIEQQLLNAAEESLDQMRVVARRSTLVVFDSPVRNSDNSRVGSTPRSVPAANSSRVETLCLSEKALPRFSWAVGQGLHARDFLSACSGVQRLPSICMPDESTAALPGSAERRGHPVGQDLTFVVASPQNLGLGVCEPINPARR